MVTWSGIGSGTALRLVWVCSATGLGTGLGLVWLCTGKHQELRGDTMEGDSGPKPPYLGFRPLCFGAEGAEVLLLV